MTHNSAKPYNSTVALPGAICLAAVLAALLFSGCGGGESTTYDYGYSAGKDFAASGYGISQCAIVARNDSVMGIIPVGTEHDFIAGCEAAL